MVEGVTKTGFKYKFDERVKTDWDFVKTASELQHNPSDISNIEKIFVMLIGEKEFKKLLNHVKKLNDGFCPIDKLSKELIEMTTADNDLKK